jgi:hypothetical protein
VTNRANVHVRLVALKLFLGHFLLHLRPEGSVAVFVHAGVPADCDQARTPPTPDRDLGVWRCERKYGAAPNQHLDRLARLARGKTNGAFGWFE